MSEISISIKSFVEGQDERTWIELFNTFYGHYYRPDFEPFDRRDVEWFKRTPWWRESRLFIADLSKKPAGFILSSIDKARKSPKGYIWQFAVKPELEGAEVDERLLKHAITWLLSAGAKVVQASAGDNMEKRISLYRLMKFKLIRSYSTMRLKPEEIPNNIRTCREVELRIVNPLKDNEDLKVLNSIHNKAFQEHFDFRPETLEETRAWFEDEGYEDYVVIAWFNDIPVGYVIATISDKPSGNRPKRGFISSIGVLKPYRRRKIGTILILEAVKWLISKGARLIELSVDDKNLTGALAFYTTIGFRTAFKTLTFIKKLYKVF